MVELLSTKLRFGEKNVDRGHFFKVVLLGKALRVLGGLRIKILYEGLL